MRALMYKNTIDSTICIYVTYCTNIDLAINNFANEIENSRDLPGGMDLYEPHVKSFIIENIGEDEDAANVLREMLSRDNLVFATI